MQDKAALGHSVKDSLLILNDMAVRKWQIIVFIIIYFLVCKDSLMFGYQGPLLSHECILDGHWGAVLLCS